jgi:colanic acid/amylovoran biosynthesis glycosyltransferase
LHLRRRLPRRELVGGLARGALRRPRAVARYIAEPRPRQPGRYLDAVAVALAPQLVHFQSGPAALERIGVRRALGCRVVVSFRPGDLGPGVPGDYGPVWANADLLHFPCETVWEHARVRGCPTTSPRAVIPPPTGEHDDPAEDLPRAAGAAFRLLSVGPLSWTAGYEYALQAVRLLVERGIECEYRIVGDGDFADAVSFARYQLELEPFVHLLGTLPPEETSRHLLWADVLLDAGVTDDYSPAIVEARLLELPVVTTQRRSPAPELLDRQVFLAPKRDPVSLAEKLAALAADPPQRAQEHPEPRPGLDEYLLEFQALYRRALA